VRNYRQILTVFSLPQYKKHVLAASPYVDSQVMAVKGSRNQPLLLKGVLIEKEDATIADYLDMISKKTGRLISAALEAGGVKKQVMRFLWDVLLRGI